MRDERVQARRVAAELAEPVREAAALARKLGLDPYPVNYWIVDHDEMNELVAYDGFQTRYPHWRWGMKYDRQRKSDRLGLGKAFELVNNDDPANAFLQESNGLADQKAVITHVEAHADFFANNQWFGLFADDRDDGEGALDAAAMLARHADLIEGYMEDPEVDREEVERFVDAVLCLEDTIDQHRPMAVADERASGDGDDSPELDLDGIDLSEEVRREVFDDDWLDARAEAERANLDEPSRDVLAYLREHGMQYDEETGRAVEMEQWQRDVLDVLRREAYYFAGQRMTKVMNEGWACVAPDTPVFTVDGLVSMADVVSDGVPVSDGDAAREVYDTNVIPDHDTVRIETRRGFELTGSNNHRVRQPDGSWVRLDALSVGDEIEVSGGNGVWPTDRVPIEWENPEYRSLDDVAAEAGVSVWTVMRYRRTGRAERADEIELALGSYDGERQDIAQRDPIRIPDEVTEPFGRFLGLLVGDGHVPSNSRHVGFTTARKAHAEEFAGLVEELFGVGPTVSEQDDRWRVYACSEALRDLLTEAFDLPTGTAAAEKRVPGAVRRSPKPVVAAFVQGLLDADGDAGQQGVILSTTSPDLSRTIQLLLANFGILSRRRERTDGCFHVHVTGESARTFAREIGFGYERKDDALREYVDDHDYFEDESWTDEVADVSEGRGTVYDVSVDRTHRYAGGGFVNHNSYWESLMMGDERFAGDDEFLTYADHQARVLGSPGLNPYKLGKELWEYVENTTNRRAVADRLLRVDGISWRNFHDAVDFDEVASVLAPDPAIAGAGPDRLDDLATMVDAGDPRVDGAAVERARDGEVDAGRYPWKLLTYEGMVERHFSLARHGNRGFIRRMGREDLERLSRYMFDDERYADVGEAAAAVDREAGWARMREVRESHNDVTFIDAFLTEEFVTDNDYFTYEYARSSGDYRVTSNDYEDVKTKLLLQFTNFGKPTVDVYDGNFDNRNELLLGHRYNGVSLDVEQAKRVLERTYELWGRPVNLMTIVKEYDDHDLEIARRRNREPTPEEVGRRIRYDGRRFETHELDPDLEARIAASEVDYDTKPEEWLA